MTKRFRGGAKPLFLVCLAPALTLALAAGCGAKRAERALESGMALLEQGHDRRAAVLLERAVRRMPQNPLAHANLGIAWLRLGETSRALASLRRAAELAPDDPRPLLWLGDEFVQLERWDEARRVLDEAQARDPESPLILTARARVEFLSGAVQPAAVLLSQALAGDPAYAPALYNMALVQRSRPEGQGAAQAYYDRYLRVAPAGDARAAKARDFLAVLQLRQEPLVAPPPSSQADTAAVSLLTSARAAIGQGDLTTALVDLKEAVRKDPRHADAWWELAILYDLTLKDEERSLEQYRHFAGAFPSDARAQEASRRIRRLTTPEGRRPLAEVVRRARPDPPRAQEAMTSALAAHRAQDWPRAVEGYLAAIACDPGSVLAALNLGLVYIAENDMEAAREALEYALQLDTRRTDTRYRLATVYRELGMTQPATDQAQAILAQQPDHAEAHQMLGLLYVDVNRIDQAKSHLRRFVELAPEDQHARQTREWLKANE